MRLAIRWKWLGANIIKRRGVVRQDIACSVVRRGVGPGAINPRRQSAFAAATVGHMVRGSAWAFGVRLGALTFARRSVVDGYIAPKATIVFWPPTDGARGDRWAFLAVRPFGRRFRMKIVLCALLATSFGLFGGAAVAADRQQASLKAPSTIDPWSMRMTFSEEFNGELDVSPWGPGTRWIAHTPWNGDFGDSRFANPVKDFPFTVRNGILRIEARRDGDGQWWSGLLSSVGRDWTGFAQKYGYFEMRAKLPEGPGLWPAFCLIGLDVQKREHTAEIDVLEHYGHWPWRFSSTVSVWNRGGKKGTHFKKYKRTSVPPGSLYEKYNTFGVAIDETWVRMFLNRKEVWRTPTQPEFRQPMFVLLNLALGPGWPIDKTPNPSYMYVDYVRVWQFKERLGQ